MTILVSGRGEVREAWEWERRREVAASFSLIMEGA